MLPRAWSTDSWFGAGPSPNCWSCGVLTSDCSLVLLRQRRLFSASATLASSSAGSPVMSGPAASTASVCSWQTRWCERRTRMPLHTLEHVGQTWSAKGSAGVTSSTADHLLWRLCTLRTRLLRNLQAFRTGYSRVDMPVDRLLLDENRWVSTG